MELALKIRLIINMGIVTTYIQHNYNIIKSSVFINLIVIGQLTYIDLLQTYSLFIPLQNMTGRQNMEMIPSVPT